MHESTEEQEAQQPDFQRYLNIARRRQLYVIIPLFLGWLLVWGSSWVIQPRYKSSTLILVEQPSIPKDYIAPNVNDDLQDRLQSITQQIMSRTRLLFIIHKLNLYNVGAKKASDDALVERMRKDIDIELVRNTRNEITAFRIYYSSSNPLIARQVTSELKDLFINETLRVRQQESEGTTEFLESQLKAASDQLAQQEAKVHAYESTHEGALPTQEASNLQILSGLQAELQSDQDALNAARQQRVLLQSEIDQYKNVREPVKSPEGVPTGAAALDLQLSKLQDQLVDLRSRYTDSYPDVKKVKDQIAQTERLRDQMAASHSASGTGEAGNTTDALPGSPLAQLQGQLKANQLEIENREQSIAGLRERINQYSSRLNDTPATEQQLAELNRGYDQSKANYDELLKRKNESEMATSMEQMQEGERFTMLDPPSLPVKPDFPNRLKFCGIGVGVGLAFGVIVAGAFEFIDDRLHSDKEIKDLLPTPVLVEIPEVVNTEDEEKGRRKLVLGWAATALVLLTIAVGTAFSFLHG